jgi:hypothetical protein
MGQAPYIRDTMHSALISRLMVHETFGLAPFDVCLVNAHSCASEHVTLNAQVFAE